MMNNLRKQVILEKLATANPRGGAEPSSKERADATQFLRKYDGGVKKEHVSAIVSGYRRLKTEDEGGRGYHDVQERMSRPVTQTSTPRRIIKSLKKRLVKADEE
jgi:hypothetical protein